MKYFSVPIAKMSLLSILAKILRGYLVAPSGDPGSNPAVGEVFLQIFFHFFKFKNDQNACTICRNRPSGVCSSLGLHSHAIVKLASLEGLETFSTSAIRWQHFVFVGKMTKM